MVVFAKSQKGKEKTMKAKARRRERQEAATFVLSKHKAHTSLQWYEEGVYRLV